MAKTPERANDVLNSWKEIAAYLSRGIRTAQRWETDLGLPVRRPRGKSRSAVIGLRSDIDGWLRSRPTAGIENFRDALPNSDSGGVRFLLTEIDSGLTFASLASTARPTENEKIARNLNNAQKAYEAVLKFRSHVKLDEPANAELDSRLEQLKSVLHGLGAAV